MFVLNLPDPESTERLGAVLARLATREKARIGETGLFIRLEGDLGAGKTTLVRAFLRALGYAGPVKSPTFSLLESYETPDFAVHHFDFYRFEEALEFEDAGFRELFVPGAVVFTEWTDKAAPYVPEAALTITLAHEGLGRSATMDGVFAAESAEAF